MTVVCPQARIRKQYILNHWEYTGNLNYTISLEVHRIVDEKQKKPSFSKSMFCNKSFLKYLYEYCQWKKLFVRSFESMRIRFFVPLHF